MSLLVLLLVFLVLLALVMPFHLLARWRLVFELIELAIPLAPQELTSLPVIITAAAAVRAAVRA